MNIKINFDNLSMLRGLAALYVVFNYARGYLFAGGTHLSAIKELDLFDKLNLAFLKLTSLGQEAVILFFVLSGFSIAHSLRVNNNAIIFITNRFIRIYSPYLFSLLFVIFIANIFSYSSWSEDYLSYLNIFKYLFYAKSDGGFTSQYWSLAYEVIFYLLALLCLLGRRSIILPLCISVLFFSVSYSIYLNHFVVIVLVEVILLHQFSIERSSITNFYAWILVIPFCLIFSTIMWYLFQRSSSNFLHKKRMLYKSNKLLTSV